MVYNLMMGF